MLRSLLARFVAVLALLTVLVSPVAAAPKETTVKELAPGVFFRTAQTEPVFIGSNTGIIVFKDYVVIVDANFPGQAKEIIQLVKKYSDKPIKYVFDTHYHGDHADGNAEFVKIGAAPIASERSRVLFDTKGIEGYENAKKSKPAEYGDLKYEKPSLYFEHKLVLDDGEQRVEFMWLGHAHTAGDAVAWMPKHGLLFTGDACVNGAFNYCGDANTESWITVLNHMEELPVKTVCPGHGDLAGKELIATQRRFFSDLRTAIKDGIAAGKSAEQIAQGIDLPWYKEWTGVEAKTRTEAITHIYEEMTGKKVNLEQKK